MRVPCGPFEKNGEVGLVRVAAGSFYDKSRSPSVYKTKPWTTTAAFMQADMVPKSPDSEAMRVMHMAVVPTKDPSSSSSRRIGEREVEVLEPGASEHSVEHIPRRLWIMHGAVMFGREFCYAMETALVTPVLLQIGLPEQYYSLTWFLSPILGLTFTPLIGSASDRCTLKWGRRRPFILALCLGTLIGLALFLNGSLMGLAAGDVPGNQPIGIVLTVLGVVVLDFCADASEGPIRAYLLDVADTEEQDMALNIHAFSAGLGGAVGYMLGGLDWTNTPLGHAFKAQEQVLFFFAAIVFVISVMLHLFSIKEHPYNPHCQEEVAGAEDADSTLSVRLNGTLPGTDLTPQLDFIGEEGPFETYADNQSEVELQLDFLNVRSKSDSALEVADTTIEIDPDLLSDVDPTLFQDLKGYQGVEMPFEHCHNGNCQTSQCSFHHQMGPSREEGPFSSTKAINGDPAGAGSPTTAAVSQQSRAAGRQPNAGTALRCRHPTFYRQPSFTFSYHGRVGFHKRPRHPDVDPPIKSSRSLNDIDVLARLQARRRLWQRGGVLPGPDEDDGRSEEGEGGTTVKLLWLSMLKMPPQLWRLCLCHLLTWFSIISQVVFYTDFIGQVIYEGDPTAPVNSTALQKYHKGVQMGCWGLVIYAATAAICSVHSPQSW
ncbi:solute carrier family 45 member 4 isoform X2 [Electrophorus electricus]|uniref:solute carrier family 45 member 4 isoform X2 n=1 Tax=Electrophorus electricus TaxID=8005 RepID=UPI0015CFABA7|nr:solute carrier family 45 member 4 isoform X2 [Electrophorus electricus]